MKLDGRKMLLWSGLRTGADSVRFDPNMVRGPSHSSFDDALIEATRVARR